MAVNSSHRSSSLRNAKASLDSHIASSIGEGLKSKSPGHGHMHRTQNVPFSPRVVGIDRSDNDYESNGVMIIGTSSKKASLIKM